ncbi:8200_t:CDS:2 [Ambispora leptoticha]|uniref:8200_t:CDS:1 n=1 Tax=Ambispora leptoticha TaxID=144679 RepID=A0A9N8Z7J6_9GLOM|nr:8200_t:CDS:2 [Ambispora leptoticha]
MSICKYFLEGRCSFGSRCKNEHPQQNGQFQAYNDRSGGSSSLLSRLGYSTGSPGNSRRNQTNTIDEKAVRDDLNKERPQYPYSVFAPGKEEPNLIEGTDFSPEELRLEFYKLRNIIGGEMQYQAGVRDLQSKFDNQFNEINKDLRGALRNFENKKRQQEQASSVFGQTNNQFMGMSTGSFGAAPATTVGGFPGGGGILPNNTTEQQFKRIDPQNIPQLSLVDPHPSSIEFEMVPDLPPQQTSPYPQLQ